MAHEALQQIKDLSKEEITAKMRSGEFIPPKKGKERDEFFNFMNMNKEAREKFLADAQPPAQTPPQPPNDGNKEEKKSEPSASTSAPVPAPEPQQKQWYEELGYENADKAKEAHKNILNLNTRLQSVIDSINAKEGKRGAQIQGLTEERDRLQKEITDLRKTAQPVVQKPQKPKRPNPKDYENGGFDERFTVAQDQYETEMDTYIEKSNEYLKESLKKEISEKLSEQVPRVPVESHADNSALWDKLFDKDIPDFQKRYNLETTVPIRRISDSYNIVDPKSKATPQERAIAQAFLSSVPQKDIEMYTKVSQAVNIAYDFSSGIPVSRYTKIDTALYDHDLLGEGKQFNVVKPVQLSAENERAAREQARLNKEKEVAAIPASTLAGQDAKLSQYQTDEEKKKRFSDLQRLYNTALNEGTDAKTRFERSQEYQEYLTLRKEVFGRPLPSYIR